MTGPAGAPGVFLDRDGTLNANPPAGEYVTRWEEFRILPGAIDAVARLKAAGCRIALATNQACVAKGRVSEADVEALHERMQQAFSAAGASIDLLQFCPHHDADACLCRKPLPGLILRGVEALGLDPARCVMVGDSSRDIGAGSAAGIATVWVTGQAYAGDRDAAVAAEPDHTAPSLRDAVDWILARVAAPRR